MTTSTYPSQPINRQMNQPEYQFHDPAQQQYRQHPQQGWSQSRGMAGNAESMTQFLGWFSIGLGLAELLMPRRVAQMIGIHDSHENETVLRAVGIREIASGVGILTQSNPAGWVKARVGGDVMDLALLGAGLNADHAEQERITKAMIAVAGVTALDLYCSRQLSHQEPAYFGDSSRQLQDWGQQPSNRQQADGQQFHQQPQQRRPAVSAQQGIHVVKTITINRPVEEIYQFWRNFENLPRFMHHLESVQVSDEQHSRWKAKAPAGMTVEWDAEIIDDTPNERISWRSTEGSDVSNAGSVRFKPAPANRGTVVTVEIEYAPPGGKLGAAIAKLFGEEPESQVQDDLRLFKQVLETGDIVRSDGTPWGPRVSQRAAQPLSDKEFSQYTGTKGQSE